MKQALWGIPVGHFSDKEHSIPIILDSQKGGFCLHYQLDDEAKAELFLENTVLQLLAEQPLKGVEVYLFDNTLRKRFPYLKDLEKVEIIHDNHDTNSYESAFNQIEQIIRRRHRELFNREIGNLHSYNQTSAFPEPYLILLINADDYPDERTTIKRWRELFQASQEAGVYFILYTTNEPEERPVEVRKWLKENLPAIILENGKFHLPEKTFAFSDFAKHYQFEPLDFNQNELIDELINQIPEEETAKDYLNIKIGTSLDGRQNISMHLGYTKGNHHAILTGRSGSGKTALLNNLILRIGEQYHANEFRLFLMDYKEGVEFQAFQNHPNVEQIYLDNSDIEAGKALLMRFANTCRERSELLKQVGVKDMDTYNVRFPNTPLPRILLIIDEFQAMYGDRNRQKEINALMKTIVKQGRSFGVHLLLATQSLINVPLDDDVKAEMGLRMTFQMIDRNASRQLLSPDNLDVVTQLGKYQLLYNDSAGQIQGNHIVRTDAPDNIQETIQRIRASRSASLCITPEVIVSKTEENNREKALPKEEKPIKDPNIDADIQKRFGNLDLSKLSKADEVLKQRQQKPNQE